MKSKPCAVIIDTYRFAAHSKGDDTRPLSYLKNIKYHYDPLNYLRKYISRDEEKKIFKRISRCINNLLIKNNITL